MADRSRPLRGLPPPDLRRACPAGFVLAGRRVALRRLRRDEGPGLRRLLLRNRAWLAPWGPEVPPRLTRADAARWIARDHVQAGAGTRLAFGVFLAGPGGHELVGHVALHSVRWGIQMSAGLGYWIDQGHAGRGLMREAVALATGFAFAGLGLNRVWAGVQLQNHDSQRLLTALGFLREGVHRRELFMAGAWRDQAHFALVRDDWPACRRAWRRAGWLRR